MKEKILQQLKVIEETKDVRVLYASEAGSRAWGYDSSTSDYDVKFIYAKPVIEYINISKKETDVILDDSLENVEFHGWDIKKFFQLMGAGAGAAEIYYAPHYFYTRTFCSEVHGLINNPMFLPLNTWCMHYRGIAKNNYHSYIKTKELMNGEEPISKKYIHVMRAIVNDRHIREYKEFPPNLMMQSMDQLKQLSLPQDVHYTTLALIQMKRAGTLPEFSRSPVLDDFIFEELADWMSNHPEVSDYKIPQDDLLRGFRKCLGLL